MKKQNGTFDDVKDMSTPDVPAGLSKPERKIWDITVDILIPTRILGRQDSAVLEAYCRSYVRWHDAEYLISQAYKRSKKSAFVSFGANGTDVVNPMINISRRAQADTIVYAQQLGMTPAARMRLDVEASTAGLKKATVFEKLKKIKDERVGKKSQAVRKSFDTEKERP